MRFKIVVLAALVLSSVLYASNAQNSSNADAERYIKESERQWAEAVASGDTAPVEGILAGDFVGVDTDGTLYDKAKAIHDTQLGAKDYVSNHLKEVTVRFYGDAAVAQGSEAWVRRSGTPLSGRYVWTDTWIRRSGKWQIVAAEDLIVADPEK